MIAGESIKQAFAREVKEEIGIDVKLEDSMLIEINAWRMDKIKNGEPFIDRAYAHVYLNEIDKNTTSFNIGLDEVSGVVKVKAKDCLDLLMHKVNKIQGIKFTNEVENVTLSIEDFLVMSEELAILKYGKILDNVINFTKENKN